MSRPTFPTYKGAEVEYGDRLFETVALTRSQLRKLTEVEEKLEQLEGTSTAEAADEIVRLICAKFDIVTRPTGGAKKSLGDRVLEDWEADKIPLDAINRFAQELDEVDPFGE